MASVSTFGGVECAQLEGRYRRRQRWSVWPLPFGMFGPAHAASPRVVRGRLSDHGVAQPDPAVPVAHDRGRSYGPQHSGRVRGRRSQDKRVARRRLTWITTATPVMPDETPFCVQRNCGPAYALRFASNRQLYVGVGGSTPQETPNGAITWSGGDDLGIAPKRSVSAVADRHSPPLATVRRTTASTRARAQPDDRSQQPSEAVHGLAGVVQQPSPSWNLPSARTLRRRTTADGPGPNRPTWSVRPSTTPPPNGLASRLRGTPISPPMSRCWS